MIMTGDQGLLFVATVYFFDKRFFYYKETRTSGIWKAAGHIDHCFKKGVFNYERKESKRMADE